MGTLNTFLGEKETEMLKNIIGKKMEKYRHDEFLLGKGVVIGNVEFFVEEKTYALFDRNHVVDFFWGKEDICDFFFKEIEEKEAISYCLDTKQIDFPMNKKIKDIIVVNDKVELFERGKLQFTYKFLSGLIFVFEDLELGFEKRTWMQELIYVHKGQKIISSFKSPNEELNEWPENQKSVNTREIIHLSGNYKK